MGCQSHIPHGERPGCLPETSRPLNLRAESVLALGVTCSAKIGAVSLLSCYPLNRQVVVIGQLGHVFESQTFGIVVVQSSFVVHAFPPLGDPAR